MKTLLIARTIKSYWATDFAQKRITKVFAPFSGSRLWRIYGCIFALYLYLLVTFIGFIKSFNYDFVIVADPRIGIIFAILKKIFYYQKPLLVHQLILPERNNFLKQVVLKLAFQEIDAAIVNSSFEKENFKKKFSKTRFFFIPLHSDPRCFSLSKKTELGSYIFSGGGAERDFDILISAAKKIDFRFLIVTFSKNNLAKIKIPKNVEVRFNLPEIEYFELIANSRFVVVPLKMVGRSAGQTTVVQAMSIGKAIVATNISGLTDYIEDGKTGSLVEAGNVQDLIKTIDKLLKNNAELKKISEASLEFAQTNFTYEIYDQRMTKVFAELELSLKKRSNSA